MSFFREPAKAEQLAVKLHAEAKSGQLSARHQLLIWAYHHATLYYHSKVDRERTLSRRDAEDLVAAFCLEFDRAWPRMHSLVHYTRRMLKNNLRRYLSRKRQRALRECSMSYENLCDHMDALEWAESIESLDQLDDARWLKLRVVAEVLRTADDRTRKILELRVQDPPMSYREIAERVGSTETALRMRAARFYEAVRVVHSRTVNTQREQAPGASESTCHVGADLLRIGREPALTL